jgi:hypothetical protein
VSGNEWGDPHLNGTDAGGNGFNFTTTNGQSGEVVDDFNSTGMQVYAQRTQVGNGSVTEDTSESIYAGNSQVNVQAGGHVQVNGQNVGQGAYNLGGGAWLNVDGSGNATVTSPNATWTATNQGDHIDSSVSADANSLRPGGQMSDALAGHQDSNDADYQVGSPGFGGGGGFGPGGPGGFGPGGPGGFGPGGPGGFGPGGPIGFGPGGPGGFGPGGPGGFGPGGPGGFGPGGPGGPGMPHHRHHRHHPTPPGGIMPPAGPGGPGGFGPGGPGGFGPGGPGGFGPGGPGGFGPGGPGGFGGGGWGPGGPGGGEFGPGGTVSASEWGDPHLQGTNAQGGSFNLTTTNGQSGEVVDDFNSTGMQVYAQRTQVGNGSVTEDTSETINAGHSQIYDQAGGNISINGRQVGPGSYNLGGGAWANVDNGGNLTVTSRNATWTATNQGDHIDSSVSADAGSLRWGGQLSDALLGNADSNDNDYRVA